MANSDKKILVTPNTGQSGQPTTVFTGAGNVPVTQRQLDDGYGTLAYESGAGGATNQFLHVNNNNSAGSLWTVSDTAGMPIIDVQADGTIRLSGRVIMPYSAIPDGSIGREKLAPDTQRLVNFQRHVYGNRVSFTYSANYTYWTVAIDRKLPTSNLYVQLRLSMRNNYSDVLTHECYFAGRWTKAPMAYDAGFSANSRPFSTDFYLENIGEDWTGVNQMQFRYRSKNAEGGQAPATIWNPNTSDDTRNGQEISSVTIWEIQP